MVQYLHNSVIHTNVLKFNHTCQLTVLISLESSIGFTDSYKILIHLYVLLNCASTEPFSATCGEMLHKYFTRMW